MAIQGFNPWYLIAYYLIVNSKLAQAVCQLVFVGNREFLSNVKLTYLAGLQPSMIVTDPKTLAGHPRFKFGVPFMCVATHADAIQEDNDLTSFQNFGQDFTIFVFNGIPVQLRRLGTFKTLGKLKTVFLKSISADTSMAVPVEEISSHRMLDITSADSEMMNGRHVKMAALKLSHYALLSNGKPVSGFTYYFCEHISRKYNFTYELEVGLRSISKNSNGSWNGYIGDLIADRSDAFGFVGHVLYRHGYVEFTTHVFSTAVGHYIAPQPIRVKWQALIDPLDPVTWLLVLATTLAVMPPLYLSFRGVGLHRLSQTASFYLAVSIPMGVMLQTNVQILHKARFLTILLIFFALVISTCYNCNLISCLTLPQRDPIPRTPEALARDRHLWNVTMINVIGGSAEQFVQTTTNPVISTIRRGLHWDTNFDRCVGLAIKKRGNACMGWNFVVEKILADKFSLPGDDWKPLIPFQDGVWSIHCTVLLPPKTKYWRFWNTVVGRLRDVGLFELWIKRTLDYSKAHSPKLSAETVAMLRRVKEESEGRLDHALSLHSFFICVATVSFGWLLSLVAFFGEFVLMYNGKERILP